MTRETMSIHKALTEKKLLNSRINKAIAEGVFCVANKHSNEKIGGIPIADYEKVIQGSWDKADDLIKRMSAIERAIVLSNASTKVAISGKEYTVAEAIWMKNHGIEKLQGVVNAMQKQYKQAQAEISRRNGDDLEARADQYVTAIYGQRDGKTNTADIDKVRTDFLKANTYELLDPIHILEKIEELEKRINDFMSEVDAALSCSNALTEITIEY